MRQRTTGAKDNETLYERKRNKPMKSAIWMGFALCILMALTLAGCGGGDSGSSTPSPPPSSSPPPTMTPPMNPSTTQTPSEPSAKPEEAEAAKAEAKPEDDDDPWAGEEKKTVVGAIGQAFLRGVTPGPVGPAAKIAPPKAAN